MHAAYQIVGEEETGAGPEKQRHPGMQQAVYTEVLANWRCQYRMESLLLRRLGTP
jgi:hypothetical protein